MRARGRQAMKQPELTNWESSQPIRPTLPSHFDEFLQDSRERRRVVNILEAKSALTWGLMIRNSSISPTVGSNTLDPLVLRPSERKIVTMACIGNSGESVATAISQNVIASLGLCASFDKRLHTIRGGEIDTIILTGTEYGSGSYRDWAAKGSLSCYYQKL
ncbi:hypothetical protein Nepgr_000521 [Nepenthes gracilis]|uniref:Uncharacterized protein n=1 Tax=Nepenthes gracilis TaxID=150966 RepID=A0AAD3RVI1_NEPGR|nr:hypothetical protein Nepgr_000521 [Nepenthes gracilis]